MLRSESVNRRVCDGDRQGRREPSDSDPEEDPCKLGLAPGDYLEVVVERGKVVMTHSAKEAVRFLHAETKRRKTGGFLDAARQQVLISASLTTP
jgi:hypothetical protein